MLHAYLLEASVGQEPDLEASNAPNPDRCAPGTHLWERHWVLVLQWSGAVQSATSPWTQSPLDVPLAP